MALLVKKFGGSSVADLDRIKHVADIIIEARNQGDDLVVVLSAMAGETDKLITLAESLSEKPDFREKDALLATGELQTITLLSLLLREKRCPAISLNAAQVRIITDNQHQYATIKTIETNHLKRHLAAGIVPVVAGFQGVNEFGEFTTLDRGGSDATAMALAYALKADECQIYTDVKGVFSADPRVVETAHAIPNLSYDSMLQMADSGAKVLQRYSVEIAKSHQVPLRVVSTFHADAEGSLIVPKTHCQFNAPAVTAIAHQKDLVLLSFTAQSPARELAQIVSLFQRETVKIHHISQQFFSSGLALNLIVSASGFNRIEKSLYDWLHHWPQMKFSFERDRAELALVGDALGSQEFLTLQTILEKQGVVPDLIFSSPLKITLIFNQKSLQSLLMVLHQALIEGKA